MAVMIRLTMSLMILGWAALMTSQLANITVLNDAWVVLAPSALLPAWFPSEFRLLTAFQIAIVLFGLGLSLVSLAHIPFEGTSLGTRLGRRAAPITFTAYAIAVITLLLI